MGFQAWLEAVAAQRRPAPVNTHDVAGSPASLLRSTTPRGPKMSGPDEHDQRTVAARNAVATTFVLNGLLFATLLSRVPDFRERLDLTNGGLGLLLLSISVGSLIGLPSSGRLVERFGAAGVVRAAALLAVLGLARSRRRRGLEVEAVAAAGAGLLRLRYGGLGRRHERRGHRGRAPHRPHRAAALPRRLEPRLHRRRGDRRAGHPVRRTAPRALPPRRRGRPGASRLGRRRSYLAASSPTTTRTRRPGGSAWLEPRTVAIGAMVLAFTLAEGSANDWLALALVDGYDARHFVGVAGFALFVTAMTTGRLVGPVAAGPASAGCRCCSSPRRRRSPGCCSSITSGQPVVAAVGIVVWGLGAALGFPVGHQRRRATTRGGPPRRVSVVSTVGYGAFLAGPPLLGFVGNQVGTLDSLYVVVAAMVPAAVLVLAVRSPVRGTAAGRDRGDGRAP